MEEINKTQADSVTLDINEDPYRHHISDGQDSEFLRVLCDALDVGVSILDENLNYRFISDSVFRTLKMDKGELSVGDSLSKCHELMMEKGLLTPELLEENKLSAEEQHKHIENDEQDIPTIVKLADGSTQKFIRKTLPNGYTVSMSHDVSELFEKDHLLGEALALGNAGYWMFDIPTKSYELSRTLKSMLSAKHIEQVKSKGIFSMIHPEDRAEAQNALRNAKNNNDTFIYTARAITRSGKYLWGSTSGDIVRDKEGKPQKIRAFVKDVTRERHQAKALERAKDDAIAASHAKSEFLANMSHEIRTPMNGILGMAELLANSNIDDRQRDFVNVINNSATALLTIINDILDFSKIEAGAFKIDPIPFDLKNTINDVLSMLTPRACEKGLELIINYPAELNTHFICDEGRLRQVITNLVGNAIKFTKTGHIITDVNISPPRNGMAFVTISVTDTGIGIEAEKIDRVFQKFTQADGSTTRVYGGTGLGLSISKAIVEMMDGRLTARSELGKGSSFTMHIPMQIDKNAIAKTYDTTVLQGKRALIIDDIDVNRQLLMEQLASWNIKSDAVKNGVEAMTQLKNSVTQNQAYDLILLDFLMPGMNGKELAAIISETESLAHIPIIMLSSCDQPVSNQELKAIGIKNYLIKPAREARLYDAVVNTLNAFQNFSPAQDEDKLIQTPSDEEKAAKTEILVAEDFPLNRDVVKLMLADTPYEPIFVENGLEAVQTFKEDPDRFPVIIMDVSMPVMDGHEATGLIQTFEREHGLMPIPIVALTGHALKNDREECIEAGMCDYLTKPVKQSELLTKLNLWVGDASINAQKRSA